MAITQAACESPAFCRGDSNCDGNVDFFDIDPFVLALAGEAAFQDIYPGCAWLNSDANGDGLVDFFDIDPLVGALGTACLAPGLEGVWLGPGVECSTALCRIDCNQNGWHDTDDIATGASTDCNLDAIPDECQDCDGDGLGDVCQIAAALAADVNENWIPDACEFDCDQNGLPDAYEISSGLQTDCDGNGVPDACEIALGTATDCNADQIPDNCQLAANDCNANGLPDGCDADDNDNGVPDDCEPPLPVTGSNDGLDLGGSGPVDIDIFNGLENACGNGTGCGGQPVAEADEETKGAVTVANHNDTNGDGILDVNQDVVTAADARGRNEIDLMKIIVRPPANFDPNSRVTLNSIGVPVRIWHAPTKVEEQPYPISFRTNVLPLTFWVEAVEPSAALRDIRIEAVFHSDVLPDSRDEVRATGVWVMPSVVRATRGLAGTTNDIPADLDSTSLRALINKTLAVDGTRFGYGSQRNQGGRDLSVGGRILFELQLMPSGADTLPITFDVSRNVHASDYRIASGSGSPVKWTPTLKQSFPESKTPPQNIESPNDDKDSTDEDNAPIGNHIYGWDTPSQFRTAVAGGAPQAFWVRRDLFREFVRVRIGAGQQFVNGDGRLQGSRASAYVDWHYVDYLVRDAAGLWTPDTRVASASTPVRSGRGNGTATVTVLSQAETEGFVATYDRSLRTWTLDGTSSPPVSVAVAGSTPPGTRWRLIVPGRVQLEITEGTTSFAGGDSFTFSVFRSTNKQNANGTGTGSINPDDPP